jgi:hypothetical protein
MHSQRTEPIADHQPLEDKEIVLHQATHNELRYRHIASQQSTQQVESIEHWQAYLC